jgi:hypothetical protein
MEKASGRKKEKRLPDPRHRLGDAGAWAGERLALALFTQLAITSKINGNYTRR